MSYLMQYVFLIIMVWLEQSAEGTTGVDVSSTVSTEAWRCLKKNGNNFAIVRVFQSTGKPDPNAASSIKNARAAGFEYVDGYIFPCFKCGNPAAQVKQTLDNLQKENAKINQVWVDVEGTQYWGKDKSANVKFIQDMVDAIKDNKQKPAMYTSASQWEPITGNSNNFKELDLWYAHYDNTPNFKDFKPFGGWTKPAIKQYKQNVQECGVGVDKNWYP